MFIHSGNVTPMITQHDSNKTFDNKIIFFYLGDLSQMKIYNIFNIFIINIIPLPCSYTGLR